MIGCSSPRQDAGGNPSSIRIVRVAAASDLTYALEALATEFERAHPGVEVRTTFGSSGNLFAQLQQRAPFDLFLSADADYPQQLIERDLAWPDSRFQYASGELVVWVRADSPLSADLEREGVRIVLHPSVQKIALANPRHAPYGRAALAALEHLGLADQVAERLVFGENVAQAAQFADVGGADVGIIARSLAVAPPMLSRGKFVDVPLDSHPPLDQVGVMLRSAENREDVEAFCRFLQSDAGRTGLAKFGFRVIESDRTAR